MGFRSVVRAGEIRHISLLDLIYPRLVQLAFFLQTAQNHKSNNNSIKGKINLSLFQPEINNFQNETRFSSVNISTNKSNDCKRMPTLILNILLNYQAVVLRAEQELTKKKKTFETLLFNCVCRFHAMYSELKIK